MNKKISKYIAVAAVLAILFLAALISMEYFFGYKYKYQSSGALILSDFADPVPYLKELSQKQKFIIVTSFVENSELNSYMGSGMNTILVVLTGNEKEAVNIVKNISLAGNTVSCVSNQGDVKTVETLSTEECENYINSQADAVKIYILPPNNSLSQARIIVSENEISVQPKTASHIAGVSFLASELLYPDARDIIQRTNDLTNALGA